MRFLALIWLFAVGCAHPSTPKNSIESGASETLIHCGHLLDGNSNTAKSNVDILVASNGRIEKVGAAIAAPSGVRVIDLSAYTVLPGLIDMHVHLTSDPDDYRDLKAYAALSEDAVLTKARKHAKEMLNQGFTTVRDVGAHFGWSNVRLRDEINSGKTPGPRMQAAPFFLTIPGGGGDIEGPANMHLGVARTPEEFRSKAQDAVRGGADLLKVIASGAVLSSGAQPGEPEMTREEIRAVVEVAHQAGKKVAAHAHGAQSIKDALNAGVDTIEHASLIDDEGLRLAKRLNVPLDMDIYNGDFIDIEGTREHWPHEFLVRNKDITEKQRKNFTKALHRGLWLIYGTDAGIYPYGENAKQFKVMVDWGMKPIEAIKSATSSAAKALGWSGDVGSVAVGRYADLIAVSGDPLRDVTELERVKVVVKSGVEVVR